MAMICLEWISYEIAVFVLGSIGEVELALNSILVNILVVSFMVSLHVYLFSIPFKYDMWAYQWSGVWKLPDILTYMYSQHSCPAPHIRCIQCSLNLPDIYWIYWTMSCMTGCFHTTVNDGINMLYFPYCKCVLYENLYSIEFDSPIHTHMTISQLKHPLSLLHVHQIPVFIDKC